MSQGNLPDLSGLPAEIRQKLEIQLAAMSPEMRAHFVRNGLPQLLQRLLPKAHGAGTSNTGGAGSGSASSGGAGNRHGTAPPDLKKIAGAIAHELSNGRGRPHGHYNDTVRRGDSPGAGRWMLIALALAALFAAIWPGTGGGRQSDAGDRGVEVDAG